VDGLRIENRFGDAGGTADERLRQVIEEAHRKGIRVLFDLVLNHVHEDHAYVRDHPEWFEGGCTCGEPGCGWEEQPIECRFMPYLPDLNYKNHFVLTQVVEDTLTLIRDFDVDAVRVDAAKHMDHVIMTTLAKRLRDDHTRGGGADLYLVGETFTGGGGQAQLMEYVDRDELDGQFDFPLFWMIRDAFAQGGSFSDLENAVAEGAAAYGDAIMSPFAGNHDIARLATEIAGNDDGAWGDTVDLLASDGTDNRDLIKRISMALAFTFTQPGAPLLYYGDEIGLAGAGDPDNRRTMTFDPFLSEAQSELLSRVRAVGAARAASKALRRGERVPLYVDDDLLVYLLDAGDDGAAIVALNKGAARSESISVLGRIPDGTSLADVAADRTLTVNAGSIRIDLGAWEYAILR
jgi:glycosidase